MDGSFILLSCTWPLSLEWFLLPLFFCIRRARLALSFCRHEWLVHSLLLKGTKETFWRHLCACVVGLQIRVILCCYCSGATCGCTHWRCLRQRSHWCCWSCWSCLSREGSNLSCFTRVLHVTCFCFPRVPDDYCTTSLLFFGKPLYTGKPVSLENLVHSSRILLSYCAFLWLMLRQMQIVMINPSPSRRNLFTAQPSAKPRNNRTTDPITAGKNMANPRWIMCCAFWWTLASNSDHFLADTAPSHAGFEGYSKLILL